MARHRGGQARPRRRRHRPGHRGPRQAAPLRGGEGLRRARHRRAVPHRPADPALLRRPFEHDHAPRHDLHDRTDDHARRAGSTACGTTAGRPSPPTASARPSSSTRSSSPTTATRCSPLPVPSHRRPPGTARPPERPRRRAPAGATNRGASSRSGTWSTRYASSIARPHSRRSPPRRARAADRRGPSDAPRERQRGQQRGADAHRSPDSPEPATVHRPRRRHRVGEDRPDAPEVTRLVGHDRHDRDRRQPPPISSTTASITAVCEATTTLGTNRRSAHRAIAGESRVRSTTGASKRWRAKVTGRLPQWQRPASIVPLVINRTAPSVGGLLHRADQPVVLIAEVGARRRRGRRASTRRGRVGPRRSTARRRSMRSRSRLGAAGRRRSLDGRPADARTSA